MALRLSVPALAIRPSHSKPHPSLLSFFCNDYSSSHCTRWRQTLAFSRQTRSRCVKSEESDASETEEEWGKVSAVLFDMDGVLCDSEQLSRLAAVDVFAEMGVQVTTQDFIPFMGTGEANFLGGVASAKGVEGFNPEEAKKRFFQIYLDKYAKPNSGIGFPGAYQLITHCKASGLKVAVASSADRIKVDANLAAAGLPVSMFDAIVSADAFDNLKPAPDIFIAASKSLGVLPGEDHQLLHVLNLAATASDRLSTAEVDPLGHTINWTVRWVGHSRSILGSMGTSLWVSYPFRHLLGTDTPWILPVHCN